MAFAAWPHLAGAFFPIRSVQHSDPAWTGSCEQGGAELGTCKEVFGVTWEHGSGHLGGDVLGTSGLYRQAQ